MTSKTARRSPRRDREQNSFGDDYVSAILDEWGEVVQPVPPPVAESLRYMVARLRLGEGSAVQGPLGLTSAISGEGVTFLSRALGLVLSEAGRQVCVVDLNWWSPPAWPGEDHDEGGVAGVIRGWSPLEGAIVATGNSSLAVLPAGKAGALERTQLAQSAELDQVLTDLTSMFDQVIVDLPAIQTTGEALNLAQRCGALALCVHQGVTSETQVKAALEELAGMELLGVILNRNASRVPGAIRRRLGEK